ncbi:MAG: lipid-A-disaccharide synthase, partial [Proteobacteria bacterium]|nr:lipid-A-disaccharide synthase [Pseudomonadota bacterium]
MLKIGIVAGEPSGDILGADLIRTIRKNAPEIELTGIGGKELQSEGCKSLYPMQRLSVMGLVEVLKRLPELISIRRGLKRYFIENPPDVFIGIDSPDFNLPLEKYLRSKGINTIHYVSPSVWAWREGRLKSIARSVDMMLTLFPFEKQFYDRHAIPALYAGHPLAREIEDRTDRLEAVNELGLESGSAYIAILPGSRAAEIRRLTPEFLAACLQCK